MKNICMKYGSAISTKYKFNLIDCLIDRAYKINSSLHGFTKDIAKIKKFFAQNRFSQFLLNRRISVKLYKLKNPNEEVATASKQVVHASMPFMSSSSNNKLQKTIFKLVSEFLPHVELRLAFKNDFTTASFFRFKDQIPMMVRSNIVYIYKCGICNSRYIGETSRHYTTRVAEHMGVSPRTGKPMSKVNSNVYAHFLESGHSIKRENFAILYSRGSLDLKLAESIAIHQLQPDLNSQVASVPLDVLSV